MKDRAEFIAELIHRFPEVKQEILDEDYRQSITLQMGCLKRFVQEAVDRNDAQLAKSVFDFLESMINIVTHDVENSIYITFLGHLDFSKRPELKSLLGDRLKTGLEEIERYRRNALKSVAKDFLDGLENT